MIVICPNCSNIDYDKLKDVVGEENIDCCCMGYCSQSDDQTVGYIDGEFVQTYSEEEFLKKCKESK
ncbi:MAG: DUF1450 domain-containing protein [Clostridium sp.]